MTAYLNLTRSGLRAFLRDRTGFFWSFFFPVFFIIIFGSLFSAADDKKQDIKLDLGLVSPSLPWLDTAFGHAFRVHHGTLAEERKELLEGKIHAVLVLPEDFQERLGTGEQAAAQVLYDPTQQQTSQIARTVIRAILEEMEKRVSQRPKLIETREEAVSASTAGGHHVRQIDFLIPGILAMTIMQLGLFTAIPIINMREKGIMRRLRATPLPRSTLVASQITQRLCIAFLQAAILLTLGAMLYQFRVAGSWAVLIGLVVLGVLTFICLGAVISAIGKTQETGVSVVQFVNLPMMFLSGIFFPVDLMGPTVKQISYLLPATYLADALRHVAIAAPSRYSLPVDLLVLGGWMLGALFVASRTFRWE